MIQHSKDALVQDVTRRASAAIACLIGHLVRVPFTSLPTTDPLFWHIIPKEIWIPVFVPAPAAQLAQFKTDCWERVWLQSKVNQGNFGVWQYEMDQGKLLDFGTECLRS